MEYLGLMARKVSVAKLGRQEKGGLPVVTGSTVKGDLRVILEHPDRLEILENLEGWDQQGRQGQPGRWWREKRCQDHRDPPDRTGSQGHRGCRDQRERSVPGETRANGVRLESQAFLENQDHRARKDGQGTREWLELRVTRERLE